MVTARLYVEGGGDTKPLRSACRRGFRKLLQKAGLTGAMPRIIASGSRRAAYEDFCTALRQASEHDHFFLLVDSEEAIPKADVLTGLKNASRPAETRGQYRKNKHSFEILAILDPTRLRTASPHADQFLSSLSRLKR